MHDDEYNKKDTKQGVINIQCVQLPPQQNIYAFCDVDDTLIDTNGNLNMALIAVLKLHHISQIVLITSYSLYWNTAKNTPKNALRSDVVRRLKRFGLDVVAVVVSASAYHQEINTLGGYYQEHIEPVEKRCRQLWLDKNEPPEIESVLSGKKEQIDAELQLINTRIKEELSQIKGGKQHLLEFSLKFVPDGAKCIVYDDKPEVNEAVKYLAKQATITDRQLTLEAYCVAFKFYPEPMLKYQEKILQLQDIAYKQSDMQLNQFISKPIARAFIILLDGSKEQILSQLTHLQTHISGMQNQQLMQDISIIIIHENDNVIVNSVKKISNDCKLTFMKKESSDLLTRLDAFANLAHKIEQSYLAKQPLH
ncbi:MAG: hypothetical protein ACK4PR_08870, partial [Gammaproteobacteria bacterium]